MSQAPFPRKLFSAYVRRPRVVERRGMIWTRLMSITAPGHHGQMDDDIPDADLGVVWTEMDPTERLQYLLVAGEEPPPEVSERMRQLYRDR